MPATDAVRLSRGDRTSLLLTISVGAFAALFTLVSTVLQIVEIVPNRDVPVVVPFMDTRVTLPIGTDGARVPVDLQEASIRVSDMAGLTVVSLVAAQVVLALATCLVIVFVCLFCRNLIRGRAFGRVNSRLIAGISFTIVGGWALTTLFSTMGVNGAFAALSDRGYDNARVEVSFLPVLAALAVAAVALAFEAGTRLERETEGLV